MKDNFSNNLKTLRESKSMTLEELANLIGVTRQTISKYERGESRPDSYILTQISRVFSCSIDSLLFDSNSDLILNDIFTILNKNSEYDNIVEDILNKLESTKNSLIKQIDNIQNDLHYIEELINTIKLKSSTK